MLVMFFFLSRGLFILIYMCVCGEPTSKRLDVDVLESLKVRVMRK